MQGLGMSYKEWNSAKDKAEKETKKAIWNFWSLIRDCNVPETLREIYFLIKAVDYPVFMAVVMDKRLLDDPDKQKMHLSFVPLPKQLNNQFSKMAFACLKSNCFNGDGRKAQSFVDDWLK